MKTTLTSLALVLLAGYTLAAGVSIDTAYEGAAGETVKVQVLLDASTPVASAQIQINYDPVLLKVLSVTNVGVAGSQFIMGYQDHCGSLDVVMACAEGSCSQSGVLFEMLFQLNAGVPLGTAIDLVLARSDLGGDYGKNLASLSPQALAFGKVSVVPSASLDTDGDGIPDAWAWRYFNTTTNLTLKADPDGDGSDNEAEYKAGTNPLDGLSVFKISRASSLLSSDKSWAGYMVKWHSVAGKRYRVERTEDLRQAFIPIEAGIEANPSENTFVDLTATNAPAYFYRISVEQ